MIVPKPTPILYRIVSRRFWCVLFNRLSAEALKRKDAS